MAGADDVGSVADIQGFAHVVVGNQYADAPFFQMADNALDVIHGNRIHPGKGLIQQNEIRVGGQAAGDFRPAPFAAGQAHSQGIANVSDMEFLEQAFHALVTFRLAQFLAGFQDRHDVFFHGQAAEDAGFLGQIADAALSAAMHGQMGDVCLIDIDPSGIRFHQAHDHVETGGLAGPVGAEQADDLAGFHVQGDIFDNPAALIAFCQVVGA